MDTRNEREDEKQVDIKSVDSPLNTRGAHGNDQTHSLTNDEDAGTDPNDVDDKASFKNSDRENRETGKFDGTIGI